MCDRAYIKGDAKVSPLNKLYIINKYHETIYCIKLKQGGSGNSTLIKCSRN